MADLQDFVTHLEFQGYEVGERDGYFRATHDRFLNMLFKEFRGGLLFTIMFGGSDFAKENIEAFKELVNELNARFGAARGYVDGDGDFMMEGFYAMPYNKAAFVTFLEVLHADEGALVQFEELRDFFA